MTRCWWLPALAGAACVQVGDVSLRGTLYDGWDGVGALPGASIAVRDASGEAYDRTRADQAGDFRVAAPMGSDIIAEIGADGFATAAFPGRTGTDEVFRVEEGSLFAVEDAEIEAWRQSFAGCPDVDAGGGVLIGEMRIRELSDPDTGEHPLVTTGSVVALMDDGGRLEACYLDDDGLAFAEGREVTGPSGRFAIFGVPAGFGTLVLAYEYAPGTIMEERTVVYMPREGVAPWFPAWVSFPG